MGDAAGDERGVTPAVGKVLEVGLVVLYVTAVAGALYGHVVPASRTAAGDALAERALSASAQHVEGAATAPGTGTVVVDVALPDRIAGETYEVRADGDRLVLVHPDDGVAASQPLVLPDRVTAVRGTWESTRETVVVVTATGDGVVVSLEGRP